MINIQYFLCLYHMWYSDTSIMQTRHHIVMYILTYLFNICLPVLTTMKHKIIFVYITLKYNSEKCVLPEFISKHKNII